MTTEETTKATKFNKSAFIRARPNMKPAEIIAEAEKIGQVISPGTIWTLRSADKRKAEGKAIKKAKADSGATKKVAKKAVKAEAKPKTFNKSAFIRKYPKLGAGEIIEKAAALGQSITPGMIYTLRSADRRASEEGVPAKKVAKKTSKKAAKKTSKKVAKKTSKKAAKKARRPLRAVTTPVTDSNSGSVTGRPSIAFDPSDPVARKFIASALASNA